MTKLGFSSLLSIEHSMISQSFIVDIKSWRIFLSIVIWFWLIFITFERLCFAPIWYQGGHPSPSLHPNVRTRNKEKCTCPLEEGSMSLCWCAKSLKKWTNFKILCRPNSGFSFASQVRVWKHIILTNGIHNKESSRFTKKC